MSMMVVDKDDGSAGARLCVLSITTEGKVRG